ncbi:MAG: hypothetical protein NTV30_08405, partial [Chloroflexi bacterium]|nr:hypothetical protein [Chloroflexota bacterium]
MMKSSEPSYRIDPDNVRGYSYDMGPARPPSEGQARSLLIRATRRCPWNKCLFCAGKRGRVGQKFEYKSVAEIKNDIDIVKGIYDIVRAASWQLGYSGSVNNEVLKSIVNGNPDIYNIEDHKELENRYQCLVHISNWIDSGARTVFIQDSDSMIMRTPELVEILKYLKTQFPSIQRITTYARGKSIN